MAAEFDCSDPSELLTGVRIGARGDRSWRTRRHPDGHGLRDRGRRLFARGRAATARRQGTRTRVAAARAHPGDRDSRCPRRVRSATRCTRSCEKFWPGGLTVILPARSSLSWDLGDARGTVALRMPANQVALALLAETGPLAVSSANLTGKPAAATAEEARADLGDAVSVYLSDGEVGGRQRGAPDPASTIVDATGARRPRAVGFGSCATASSATRRFGKSSVPTDANSLLRPHRCGCRRSSPGRSRCSSCVSAAATGCIRRSGRGMFTRSPTPRLGGVAMFLGAARRGRCRVVRPAAAFRVR